MNDPNLYLTDWNSFKEYCEDKAKIADCHINNKGWRKLRDYHLDSYLKNIDNPFAFLFNMRFRYRKIFNRVGCMHKYYSKYMRKREIAFDSRTEGMVEYPSWRKKK